MSRRASASRAAAKLTESIKKDKQQDEEDGKQDISFEVSQILISGRALRGRIFEFLAKMSY